MKLLGVWPIEAHLGTYLKRWKLLLELVRFDRKAGEVT
jgi:hypothetical protein